MHFYYADYFFRCLSIAILFASSIISQFLGVLYDITDDYLYFYLSRGIPTWGANYFPSLLIRVLITMPSTFFLNLNNDPLIPIEATNRGVSEVILVTEALQQAAIIIAVYAVIFILVAIFRFRKSDITKKTA